MKQESSRQRTMEDIDGGLHPAVDGQSLDVRCEDTFWGFKLLQYHRGRNKPRK